VTVATVATKASQVVLEVNEQKQSSNFSALWPHYFTAKTISKITNRLSLATLIFMFPRSKYQEVKADFYLNCFLNFVE
jgi:hypothetical protein